MSAVSNEPVPIEVAVTSAEIRVFVEIAIGWRNVLCVVGLSADEIIIDPVVYMVRALVCIG